MQKTAFKFDNKVIFRNDTPRANGGLSTLSFLYQKIVGVDTQNNDQFADPIKQVKAVFLIQRIDQQTYDRCMSVTEYEYFLVNLANCSLKE